MEPSSEIFRPSRQFARGAWAALVGAVVSVVCGFFAPLALLPAALSGATAALLFWLALRPVICVSASQLNLGKRAVGWQEIRAVDRVFTFPLVLRIRLTNSRRVLLTFPGDPHAIARLANQIRSRSVLAVFDGIPYQDFHVWSNLSEDEAEQLGLEQPAAMISADEEQEIEKLYQKLKTVGRLDRNSGED